jgi:hypothetical protein
MVIFGRVSKIQTKEIRVIDKAPKKEVIFQPSHHNINFSATIVFHFIML